MRSTRYTLIAFGGLLISSSLLVPVSSSAQKRGPTSGGGGGTSSRDKILGREADIQSRELQLRLLTEAGKTTTPTNEHSTEDRKLIVSQIFEDFERIQLVNREMMQLSANLNTPAYKRMSSLAEEMAKRAKRLKTNLGIPEVIHEKKEAEPVPEMDVAQVKASLQTISASVKSFVSNPLFQDPRVTDVRHLDNLRRDIANLIELSRAVKKAAAKLGSH